MTTPVVAERKRPCNAYMPRDNETWRRHPGLDAHLTRLWNGPRHKHARMIAAELNAEWGTTITKNAVIGRAHRLELPPRTTPRPAARGPRAKPEPKPEPQPPPVLVAPVPLPPPPPLRPQRPPSACCFPFGHPGQPGFRSCDAPAAYGASYCDEHRALCRLEADS